MHGDIPAWNIADLRDMARRNLPRAVFEFVDRGTEDDISLANNRAALDRIKLHPRTLVDVSKRDLSISLFGKSQPLPFCVGPTGTAGLLWYDGEVGLARAAAKAGIPFTVGINAMTSMERIIAEAGGRLWFQLYMWSDRNYSWQMVERAEKNGFEALIVTVDGAVGANREFNHRNGFSVPMQLNARLAADVLAHPRWLANVYLKQQLLRGTPKFENYPPDMQDRMTAKTFKRSILKNDSLNWDDIRELRKRWPRTLMVKGILHPRDAALAADCGADAVIVSNHGGRMLDGSPATIDALPAIVDAVGKRMTVLFDSGVRRGSDIVKAYALGAHGVLIGRATLYGTAAAGEAGAAKAIDILRDETDRIMGLLGVTDIGRIGRQCLFPDLSGGTAAPR